MPPASCPLFGSLVVDRSIQWANWIRIGRRTGGRSPIECARPVMLAVRNVDPMLAVAPFPSIAKAEHQESGYRKKDKIEIDTDAAGVEICEEVKPERRSGRKPIDRDRSPPKLRVPWPPQIVRGARPNPLLGLDDRFIRIRGRIWRHLIRIPVRDRCSKIRTLLESPIWNRWEKFVPHGRPPQATTTPSPPDIWSTHCDGAASHG